VTSIDVQVTDGVGVLTLNAPERRNAFDLAMCDETAAALDELEADDGVGALVVTGRGSAFCAGADLSHLGASQREGLLAIYEGFLRVARSPLPTIAAVNGAAVGAGMNLALAADVRLAGASARFDTRFLQLGIHPGGGHTWMLQRIAGPQATAAMVLFGEVLSGEEAAACGLAWRCVPDDPAPPSPWPATAAAPASVAAPRPPSPTWTIADHARAVGASWRPGVVRRPACVRREAAALQAKISHRS
jgi:enoyl-CoA hydratase